MMDAKFSLISRDPWLASSAMQKSIRRGDVLTAVDAARALYRLRGRAIWRRLILVACEDVGIADPIAVTNTVRLAYSDASRSDLGSVHDVLEHAVTILAQATKDRSADYLISAATVSPTLEHMREHCGSVPLAARIELALSEQVSLEERAVATWYASGLENGRERRFDQGDLLQLIAGFEARGAPSELCATVADAACAIREPMIVLLPLIWLAASGIPRDIIETSVDLGPRAAGVPLYALDKHTRLGKAAILAWLKSDQDTREALLDVIPEYKLSQAACMGAFYVDAIPIAKRLAWDQAGELYRLGRDADMFKVGVPGFAVPAVIEAVRKGMPALNEARRQILAGAVHVQSNIQRAQGTGRLL